MNAVATRAENIVKAAAEPCQPGEKVKYHKQRAFTRLRLHQVPAGDNLLHDAWNGRAGPRQLFALEEQCRQVGFDIDRELTNQILKTIGVLDATDPEFYAPAIEALRACLRPAGCMGRKEG